MPLQKASDMGTEFVLYESVSSTPKTDKYLWEETEHIRDKLFVVHRFMSMDHDGEMLVNQIRGVTYRDMQSIDPEYAYSLGDLHLRSEGETNVLLSHANERECKRAVRALSVGKARLKRFPRSRPLTNRVRFLESVIGQFVLWFERRGLTPPIPKSRSSGGTVQRKTKWTGNKSEFARYVNKEYLAHKEDYGSLSKAVLSLFPKYSFDDRKWTPAKCYGLARKV